MTQDADELITQFRAKVEDAESRLGPTHVGVSYALDDLAAALKANGQLLDAANASAKARTIRAETFGKEAQRQTEELGDAAKPSDHLSATAWLKKLHRIALCGSGLSLIVILFVPANNNSSQIAKDLGGSALAAVFFQLLLFPIKSIPRFVKYTIVAIASATFWAIISGQFLH